MKLFIDCEFNSLGGQLISMALVPLEHGDPFYREIFIKEKLNDWVCKNVVTKLDGPPYGPHLYEEAQKHLELYLAQYDEIHLIADWPDDIKYFCEFLITGPGTRINTPPLTIEIRRDLDCESLIPHHALADAIAMREKYIDLGLG